jgi:acetate kinase
LALAGAGRTKMNVLTFNLGSSSLKCAVHDVNSKRAIELFAASFEPKPRPKSAAGAAREAIAQVGSIGLAIDAIGHRFVFGGELDAPTMVDQTVVRRLEELEPLDPLHAPQAHSVLRAAIRGFPSTPQVACFDTTFFRRLPPIARALPVPSSDPLLRRYGFHGFSYESAVATLGDAVRGRTIVAHLGSGTSLAGLAGGKPVDTTMGFSPLGGVMMASRPGDLDPGVILYLLERERVDARALREMLENRSGLRALADGEGDVRELSERARKGDARAAFALECYARSISKAAGALATVLGGVDAVVFTGGIGEHQPDVRASIARALSHLGIELDDRRNAANAPQIGRPESTAAVHVVRADENRIIARHTFRCLRN